MFTVATKNGGNFDTLDAAIEAATTEAAKYVKGGEVEVWGPRPADTTTEKTARQILGDRLCLASVDHLGIVTRWHKHGGYWAGI